MTVREAIAAVTDGSSTGVMAITADDDVRLTRTDRRRIARKRQVEAAERVRSAVIAGALEAPP